LFKIYDGCLTASVRVRLYPQKAIFTAISNIVFHRSLCGAHNVPNTAHASTRAPN